MTVRARRGFTLLEVMVAVAILGLGLTAIFAAQAGSFKSVSHARNVSEATGLVRCKMSEVEEDLGRDGFQELDVSEAGPCCDGAEHSKMSCAWRVDKPEFPEAKFGELDLDSDLDFGSGSQGQGSSGLGAGAGALGLLAKGDKGTLDLPAEGGVGNVAEALVGDAGGIKDSLTTMVMSIVYPDIKAIFEAGTRRVTVVITWSEGQKDHSIELTQWVTNSKEAGLVGDIEGTTGEEEEDEPDSKKEDSKFKEKAPPR